MAYKWDWVKDLDGFEKELAKINKHLKGRPFNREVAAAFHVLFAAMYPRWKNPGGYTDKYSWEEAVCALVKMFDFGIGRMGAWSKARQFLLEGPDLSQINDLKTHTAWAICAEVLGWTGEKS